MMMIYLVFNRIRNDNNVYQLPYASNIMTWEFYELSVEVEE